jgi:hypothetical protein
VKLCAELRVSAAKLVCLSGWMRDYVLGSQMLLELAGRPVDALEALGLADQGRRGLRDDQRFSASAENVARPDRSEGDRCESPEPDRISARTRP